VVAECNAIPDLFALIWGMMFYANSIFGDCIPPFLDRSAPEPSFAVMNPR